MGRKLPILLYSIHLHLALLSGWPNTNFTKMVGVRKLKSLSCLMALPAWFCV